MLVSFSVFREEVENGVYDVNGFHPLPHPGRGIKRQTIRAERADGRVPQVGETAHLWWKSRSPTQKQKLGEFPIKSVQRFKLTMASIGVDFVTIDGEVLHDHQVDVLAKADGFVNRQAMLTFFARAHRIKIDEPFLGWVIRW